MTEPTPGPADPAEGDRPVNTPTPPTRAPATPASRARRLKSLTILSIVAWSALVFLAWSQPWFTLTATGRAGDTLSISVDGSVAGPALSALALASLALAAALAIAGTVIRAILGLLEVVLGASIVLSAISALVNPADAGQASVTKSTGVAGVGSIESIVSGSVATPWPFFAVAFGVLMALTGVSIIVTLRRWPASGRKYQPVQFSAVDGRTSGNPADFFEAEAEDATTADDITDGNDTRPAGAGTTAGSTDPDVEAADAKTRAVDSWDSMSRGQDPTL